MEREPLRTGAGETGGTGIPAGNRGQGSDNAGKSIKEWRAGRGAV